MLCGICEENTTPLPLQSPLRSDRVLLAVQKGGVAGVRCPERHSTTGEIGPTYLAIGGSNLTWATKQAALRPRFEPSKNSGTKEEPKLKLLSPDVFGWGGGLPHEGVGTQKFGMSLETREPKLL